MSVVENLAPITSAPIVPGQITQAQAFESVADEFYPNLTGDFPEIGTTGNTTEFDGGDFFFGEPNGHSRRRADGQRGDPCWLPGDDLG